MTVDPSASPPQARTARPVVLTGRVLTARAIVSVIGFRPNCCDGFADTEPAFEGDVQLDILLDTNRSGPSEEDAGPWEMVWQGEGRRSEAVRLRRGIVTATVFADGDWRPLDMPHLSSLLRFSNAQALPGVLQWLCAAITMAKGRECTPQTGTEFQRRGRSTGTGAGNSHRGYVASRL